MVRMICCCSSGTAVVSHRVPLSKGPRAYKNVERWADMIYERPAVKRGRMVNRTSGEPSSQLHERHDASDFETKTQDKLAAAN